MTKERLLLIVIGILLILLFFIAYHLYKKRQYFDKFSPSSSVGVEEAARLVKTGDILLHYADHSAATQPFSFLVRNVAQTALFGMPYTHVSLVIKQGDDVQLVSSNPKSRYDVVTNTFKDGVQLLDFETFLNDYNGLTVLMPIDKEVDPQLILRPINCICRKRFKQIPLLIADFILGRDTHDSKETLFCSDAVACLLIEAGIIMTKKKVLFTVKDIMRLAKESGKYDGPQLAIVSIVEQGRV